MGNPIRTLSSFNITDWFGKKFPRDCLQYPDLESYCDTLRTIPPQCPVNYSINAHLPIQNFLSSTFPSHSHSLVIEAASQCFTNNPPTKILATLVERDIPPDKFIQDLLLEFGQAVLDRQTSIRDPLYNRSFLPLWVLTLWERLAELNAAKKKWISARTWLQQSSRNLAPATFATATQHLARTGWCADITVGQECATTLTLPQLLADARLNGTVLDLMVQCVQTEVADSGNAGVYVCGTLFPNKVAQLWETRAKPPDWFQKRFIDPVLDSQGHTLYFPMFWPEHEHWVSVRINFDKRLISVGQ